MKSSPRHHLAPRALRIYLTYLLRETEQLLQDSKLRQRFSIFKSEGFDWQQVVDAASQVILYIENCQHDDSIAGFSIRGAHGLCAVSAAQDALSNALQVAGKCRERSHSNFTQYNNLTHHLSLRAKCLVNSIVAMNNQDPELVLLWDNAAQKLLLENQARNTDEKLRDSNAIDITEVASALEVSTSASRQANPEIRALQLIVARSHRFSAVHRVLGYTTIYYQVTRAYSRAVKYYIQEDSSSSVAAVLWRKAANIMRCATESVVRQEISDAAAEQTIVDATRSAEACTKAAREVEGYIRELESVSSKYKDQCQAGIGAAHPLHKLISTTISNVHTLLEQYVDSETGSPEANALADSIRIHLSNIKVMSKVGNDLQLSTERAAYYKSQAVRFGHIAHDELKSLWKRAWVRAAECIEESITIEAQSILAARHDEQICDSQIAGQVARNKAHMYVFCANSLIQDAVQYYNSALLTQSFRCDARVAVWWSAAFDCQLLAVSKYLADVHSVATKHPPSFMSTSAEVSLATQKATQLVLAIDYLQRSRTFSAHCKSVSLVERVTGLYSLAADLLVSRLDCDIFSRNDLHRAERLCFKLINHFTSVEELRCDRCELMVMACEISRNFVTPSQTCKVTNRRWRDAFQTCCDLYDSINCRAYDLGVLLMCKGCVALYTSAADQWAMGNTYTHAVFLFAGKFLLDKLNDHRAKANDIYFGMDLTRHICIRYADKHLVPDEMFQLPSIEINAATSQELERFLRHVGLP